MPEDGPSSAVLLEQYKLFVRSAEEVSARRSSANNYLLSVNSLLVAVHGVGSALQPDARWQLVLPVAGAIICVSWWVLIKGYRSVNAAKFQIIHELESELPTQPYTKEWGILEQGYTPLSHVEQWIPAVFGGLYLGLVVLGLRF